MHGNVWEWCHDWYGSSYGGDSTDPWGASSGSVRVMRGGSWFYPYYLRSARRDWDQPTIDFYHHSPDDYRVLGFRLARSE